MDELEELRRRELQWRQRLAGTALVMEADVDQGESIESFRWLGSRYLKCSNRDERKELLSLFRASFVIGLTAVGGRDYDEGTFWPFVNSAFGVPLAQGDIELFSTRYKQILTHYGLRRFITPMANVGEILMHAGIPVASIEGFLRLLIKQDRRGSGTNGAMFAAWARSQNRQSASMLGLDAPSWRFLREGGEIAEDFVNRCLAAFDAVASVGPELDSGLASHILDEISRLVETSALVSRPGRRARTREVSYVPALVWNGAEHGIALVLPALEALLQETVRWTLTSEGRLTSYTAEPPWPGIPATIRIHPLPHPTKAVAIRARPGDQAWDVSVVDPEDPMLVFDASSGAIIPARNSLPRDLVVIAAPRTDDQSIREIIEFNGEFSQMTDHQSPFGWESWAFASVDLSQVKSIRRSNDRARFVSTSTRPQIESQTCLLGATAADGFAVYTVPPVVVIPAAPENSAASLPWSISLADEATGLILWNAEVRSEHNPSRISLWPERPMPLLGKYVISVRGALGRGLTRRVAIAEGWTAVHHPEFRFLTSEGRGLEPAKISLVNDQGANHVVSLGRGAATENTKISGGSSELEVTLCVPHMQLAVTRGESLPVVTLLPQSIDIESLDKGQLRVTVPVGMRASLGLVSRGNTEQIIDGGISGKRAYANFNLGQFADTGRALRYGVFHLQIGERSIPVGSIRPRQLADELVYDAETSSLLISPNAPEGLTAAIYSKYAPWEAPTVINFTADASFAKLDKTITEVGEATVMIRIDDPWSPSPWPARPRRGDSNVFALSLLPLAEMDGSPGVGFSRWLAGVGDMPREPNALPLAARILSLLGTFESNRSFSSLRSQLSELFGAYPALFIDTAMLEPLEPSVLMRLVIDSNLAATGSEIPPPVPGSWPLNSFLGLVGDYEGTQENSDPEFISNLENFADSAALSLLDTGVDPHRKVGRFDDNVRILNGFPPDRLEQIWAAASPIPGRLLQPDTRMIAARELFDARTSRTLRELIASSSAVIKRSKEAIFAIVGPDGGSLIDSRIGSDGWRNLPAISMALAMVARLAARDLGNARAMYTNVRDQYAQLAEAAPAFVEQDLVIAELWIMNWRNEWTR